MFCMSQEKVVLQLDDDHDDGNGDNNDNNDDDDGSDYDDNGIGMHDDDISGNCDNS